MNPPSDDSSGPEVGDASFQSRMSIGTGLLAAAAVVWGVGSFFAYQQGLVGPRMGVAGAGLAITTVGAVIYKQFLDRSDD